MSSNISDISKKILVIDDEAGMRLMLTTYLEGEGYQVLTAPDTRTAEAILAKEEFFAIITDLSMPGGSGLDFLVRARDNGLTTPVIVMSAYGSTDSALTAMRSGAFDYVFKPFQPDEVLFSLKKAEANYELSRENAILKKVAGRRPEDGLVYKSRVMADLMALVPKVAETDSTVLVTGESGTGKELVARAIHRASPRRKGPFVAVNCGAIAESLLESELFGHIKGSFTGAQRDRDGLFRAADGGTLFLDEVGELPLGFQVKLLRAIQFAEVRPVGAETPIAFNARLVAATSRNLEKLVRAHQFREDLFYRLNVLPLYLPPLRERKDDIPFLADHFVIKFTERQGRQRPALSGDFIRTLSEYEWPGNVRELENIMDRVLVMAGDRQALTADDLPPHIRRGGSGTGSGEEELPQNLDLKGAIKNLESDYIRAALIKSRGNRSEAARQLGLSYPSLLNKIKLYDIDVNEE